MQKIILLLILFIFSCLRVQANSEIELRIVATEHQLLHYEREGKAKGPTAEIVNSILDRAKLSADIEFMPWSRAYSTAEKRPNTIVLSMVRTSERENKFHWLGVVSKLARVFISLKPNGYLDVITDQQAKNKLIAVTRNSNSYNELKAKGFSENKNLYIVASIQEAFKLLNKGRVDLVFNDPSSVKQYLLTQNMNQQQVKFNAIVAKDRRNSYIAININSDSELVNKLKLAMKEYQQTDRYLYLLNKEGE
jgi:ABC-type amino acid transport substrate-binding protein